ncbi:MAG: thioredoxin family protein [Fimbriimonadaceae bacterium]|nr:thioredoxin family protein [Fimbriimonadaceae bacterium]
MVSALSLTALAMLRDRPPLERLEDFLGRSPEMTIQLDVEQLIPPGPSLPLVFRRAPGRRSTVVSSPVGEFSWVQNQGISLWKDGSTRVYQEYPGRPLEAQASDLAPPTFLRIRPTHLLDVGLRFLKEVPFKEENGVLVASEEGQGGRVTWRLQIDASGAPIVFEQKNEGMLTTHIRFRLKSVDRNPIPAPVFDTEPPTGWEPNHLPVRVAIAPGEKAPELKLKSAAGGQDRDLPRDRVLVFTSPDCPASDRLQASWAKVKAGLGPLKPIEVVLDARAPARLGGEALRDVDGRVDLALGIPVTPYFLRIDRDGMVIAAFSGFGVGDENEVGRVLQRPDQKEPEE